jgi:hypothetical protein
MFTQAETIDVSCDAPSYAIVRVCQWLGFHAPLDVAWYHLGRYLRAHAPRTHILGMFGLAGLFGGSKSIPTVCRCGLPLPALDRCILALGTAKDDAIRLGQCSCCHTMFWDQC